jgi:hypothetical protein
MFEIGVGSQIYCFETLCPGLLTRGVCAYPSTIRQFSTLCLSPFQSVFGLTCQPRAVQSSPKPFSPRLRPELPSWLTQTHNRRPEPDTFETFRVYS